MTAPQTHSIGFTYTAKGKITVAAGSLDEAETKAQERLEQLQELGAIHDQRNDEIVWTDDEVEVW